MKNQNTKSRQLWLAFSIILFVNSVFLGNLQAQPRGRMAGSPIVNPDKSVTFNFVAPDADQVMLYSEFIEEDLPMAKNESGVWTVTTEPIKPDIYPYCFVVDGIQVADPSNEQIFANERFKYSLVDISGDEPLIHSLQKVPHGDITYCNYFSETLDTYRPLVIYTPPGYRKSNKKYPVLYLIHGGSDTQETWFRVGKVNYILDNLIAQKKAVPMVIVMPYGSAWGFPVGAFPKDIVNDVIPYVEDNYNVYTDQAHRGVAGFSVGGGQTLNIGLMNTDKFDYVSSYSPYTLTEEWRANFENWNPDVEKMNKDLKLFSISVGEDDYLFESIDKAINMYKDKGFDMDIFITDGAHTWMNCRKFIARTAQQVFKE
ncbi:MAG TPA: alpha/beta hydrolase-fold protein [Draconibacterium sp.]|nr:alpha/beta hydrolase-fold protein [Draconibacterium sp.]